MTYVFPDVIRFIERDFVSSGIMSQLISTHNSLIDEKISYTCDRSALENPLEENSLVILENFSTSLNI